MASLLSPQTCLAFNNKRLRTLQRGSVLLLLGTDGHTPLIIDYDNHICLSSGCVTVANFQTSQLNLAVMDGNNHTKLGEPKT